MEIREVQDKNIWESFLSGCKDKTFLQSWNWGEFQKMMGNKIWRLGVYDKGELLSVCLIILVKAKRGRFLLVQHGPNIKEERVESKKQVLKILLDELKNKRRKETVDFIRIAPLLQRSEENNKIFRNLGFKESPMHASAYEATWKLDITSSEEELLKSMRKTTRYLIRQAQKDADIETFRRWSINDVNIFYQIHQEVVKIQKFTPFSLEYLKSEFSAFLSDSQASLFFGEYKGQIIAAAFVVFWSNIGFYHHAALLPKYHKIPIAYLLQWEAIKEAKRRNCILYDFWGYVNPKENPNHPWAGPTLFKMGFGGRPYKYLKTQDLPLSKKYWLIYLFEKLRKTKRGL
jgi:lipid II:glycine glycyltransferase (peptidoglycan interpeptide bridge formation enzyme)